MIYLIVLWVINAVALMVVAWILPGFHIESFYAAMMTALVLGLLNALVRPIILLLTLPITILTLGLFTFVVNAAILTLASTIVKGFNVESFASALAAAALLWLISFISNLLTARLES